MKTPIVRFYIYVYIIFFSVISLVKETIEITLTQTSFAIATITHNKKFYVACVLYPLSGVLVTTQIFKW